LYWGITHTHGALCCDLLSFAVLCHSTVCMYCTVYTEQQQGTGSRPVSDWRESSFFFFLVRSFGKSKRNGEGPFFIFLQQLSNTVCVECEAVRERVQLFNFSKKIDRNIEIFKIFVLQKNVRIVEN
jgi:hypothetical protein